MFSGKLSAIYSFTDVQRTIRYDAYDKRGNNIYWNKFSNSVRILGPFSAGQPLMGTLFYCWLYFLRTTAWFVLSESHKLCL